MTVVRVLTESIGFPYTRQARMLNKVRTLTQLRAHGTSATLSGTPIRGHGVKRLTVIVSVAILLSGCGGRSSTPTAPGPPASPSVPTVTYTLSGTVTEMTTTGVAPVEGVRVEEQSSRRSAMTDANGVYRLSGAYGADTLVSTTKAGYVSSRKIVTISGDTQLDIRVDRIVSYVLSGEVFEMTEVGRVPIEGVGLYCDGCGSPVGHTSVLTDAGGLYRFSWTFNGLNPIFVGKPGYAVVDLTGTLLDREGRVQVTVNGDTRFDIQLARR